MSKELSASAKSFSDGRECFIEVYIHNQSLIGIVYNNGLYHFSWSLPLSVMFWVIMLGCDIVVIIFVKIWLKWVADSGHLKTDFWLA